MSQELAIQLIDTHGHLNFAAFTETWAEVADRARDRGVVAIVMPGSQYPTSKRAIELARERPGFLWAAVGLHPTHVRGKSQIPSTKFQTEGKFEDFDYENYLALARQPEVVAIGEVGLDTYRIQAQSSKFKIQSDNLKLTTEDVLDAQVKILQQFMVMAHDVNKPLILHCRGKKKPENRIPNDEFRMTNDPHERLIEILSALSEQSRPRFVVHCYQGNVAQAERYLALGGLISLTGSITYSDEPAVTEVVRAIPLERLMLETDSPYLSPVPYRGESNEPWKVREVARRVADLQGLKIEEVARQTTATARDFFRIDH